MNIYEFLVLRIILLFPTIHVVYAFALTIRPRQNTTGPACYSSCIDASNLALTLGLGECHSADYVCICGSTEDRQYLIDCTAYRCSNQADYDAAIQSITALCNGNGSTSPTGLSTPPSPTGPSSSSTDSAESSSSIESTGSPTEPTSQSAASTGSSPAASSNSATSTAMHTGSSTSPPPTDTQRGLSDAPQETSKIAPIAGGVAGGVVIIILIALACFHWRDKLKSTFRGRNPPSDPAGQAPIQTSKSLQPSELSKTPSPKPSEPLAHMPVPILAPTPRPFQTPKPPQTPAPTQSPAPNSQPTSQPPE